MIRTNDIQPNISNSLGIISGLQRIYEIERFYATVTEQMLFEDGKIFEFHNGKLLFHFSNLIESAIKLFTVIARSIKTLIRAITVRTSDVRLNNNKFLSKYGKRLREIGHLEYDFQGIDLRHGVNSLSSDACFKSQVSFNNAKSVLLDGKRLFKNDTDLDLLIGKNRALLLNDNSVSLQQVCINNAMFKSLLDEKFNAGEVYKITVSDAVSMLQGYDEHVTFIKRISSNCKAQADQDIKELNKLKDVLKKSNATLTNDVSTEEIKEQFNTLIKYRKQIKNDCILFIEMLSDSMDKSNKQAKVLCIRALREN